MTPKGLSMTRTYSDIVYNILPTQLGEVLLAANSQGLVGIWFLDQAHFPDITDWQRVREHRVLREAHGQLQEYLDGLRQTFELPLAFATGTPFQQRVWQALVAIPYGKTTSYGQIASRVGSPTAVRAVGAAVGRNPLSMVVPCHRVLGAAGALTGYAGGLERKKALLSLEAAHT
jgi:methylated-DNA-[protein]-cysteine S-methyltransferase